MLDAEYMVFEQAIVYLFVEILVPDFSILHEHKGKYIMVRQL